MELKFKLGQRLWPIQRMTRWFVQRPFDLMFIMLKDCVLYSFTAEYGFTECDVFATEAEALAECQRRNAK